MIGLALIVLAAIFGGAALFRKHVLEMITNALTSGITKNTSLNGIQGIMDKLKMVRSIGIADTVMDWMDLRRKEPPIDKTPRPIRPDGGARVDSERFPEVLDPEAEEAWEGQPPKNWPHGEIPGRTIYDVDDYKANDVWEGQPPQSGIPQELTAGKNTGITLNTARATPPGVTGMKTAGTAAGAGTAAKAAATTGAGIVAGPVGDVAAAGAAGAKKAEEFAKGEAKAVTGSHSEDKTVKSLIAGTKNDAPVIPSEMTNMTAKTASTIGSGVVSGSAGVAAKAVTGSADGTKGLVNSDKHMDKKAAAEVKNAMQAAPPEVVGAKSITKTGANAVTNPSGVATAGEFTGVRKLTGGEAGNRPAESTTQAAVKVAPQKPETPPINHQQVNQSTEAVAKTNTGKTSQQVIRQKPEANESPAVNTGKNVSTPQPEKTPVVPPVKPSIPDQQQPLPPTQSN
ncbi:hypothetical protein [Desulfotomaculum copahuensis]|uniref:Uncharacterized protein n=1 Tax=Desulfotomaculum copahuensis TaxID=1838280 RepID=A0A1B7LG30_9FIRM|nr:hypothetical protein [Desulfotomaculum copahuensis]OAT83702.1 hypothetical protein A6M21_07650 [Desulfotomaculum copahuensis]